MNRNNLLTEEETQPMKDSYDDDIIEEDKHENKDKKYKSDSEDDIADCPVLKDQMGSFTPDQLKEMRKKYDEIVKPMMRSKKAEEEKKHEEEIPKEEKKSKKKSRHPRFDQYRQSQGSCPYMNTSKIYNINRTH